MNIPRYKLTGSYVPTLESLYCFSIVEWRRDGLLQTNEIFRITLMQYNHTSGIVLVEPSLTDHHVAFTIFNDEFKCKKLNIRLVKTKCHYGGKRFWFMCPYCATKRTKLFLHNEELKCRSCMGRPYKSQNESKSDRLLRRARAARKKLGADNNLLHPLNGKPKGMHWKTYIQLADRANRFI